MTTNSLIQKLWNFCDTLRDDGVSYGDYLEQLTFLLFLKMADEYSKPPYSRKIKIPKEYNWQSLVNNDLKGAALENHYNEILKELGKENKTMLGYVYAKAQNKIQDPSKLYKLVRMINEEEWVGMDADIKGDIYEGLLQKNAEDVKSGAGQYFTPRPLIQAMVECLQLKPNKTIADPTCGTGGFFLAAYDYLAKQKLNKDEKHFLKYKTFHGWELVASTARMCIMNLLLHSIGDIDSDPPIERNDSLLSKPSENFDYVLANPPFGKKSSITVTNEEGKLEKEDLTYNREDFFVTTSNKQLNFVQHIISMLKVDGKAAVVLPDNVLFEGGAGEIVRKRLMEKCNLHTILRLPTGLFYAQGVKANVLFFDNKPAAKTAHTKDVWIYDYRTNIHHTLKTNPLKFEHLQDFVDCFNADNINKRKETERFKKFSHKEICERDKTSLDIFWLKDDSVTDMDNIAPPKEIAKGIVSKVENALNSFKKVEKSL